MASFINSEIFEVVEPRLSPQLFAGGNNVAIAHMISWYPVNNDIYVFVSAAAPVLPGTAISWAKAYGLTTLRQSEQSWML